MDPTAIQTALQNMQTALVNATAVLAQLDAKAAADPTASLSMTYTLAGRTVGWNEYRAALMRQVQDMRESVASLTALAWQGQTVISVVR